MLSFDTFHDLRPTIKTINIKSESWDEKSLVWIQNFMGLDSCFHLIYKTPTSQPTPLPSL